MKKQKFHVSDSGEVVECKATTIPCPKENFDTIEEAEAYKEKLFAQESTTISKSDRNSTRKAEKYYGGGFVEPYTMNLTPGVEKVLDDLYTIGNPLIVGGAVRDTLVNAGNKDIDIEVHGTDIDELSQQLRQKGYQVDEVGKQFGVLKVSKKGGIRDLDISVPRKENRTGAGHKSFSVEMDKEMTVSEAAERRDFTFNAIMYDHKRKVLVDPSGGRQDFENGVMKHVSAKFAEDPLRVLRGFQFAARFDLTMDDYTAKMCQSLKDEYKTLSVERVQEEWGKFFTKGRNYEKGVRTLQKTGWDDVEKGLAESLGQDNTVRCLKNLHMIKDYKKRSIMGAAMIMKNMSNDEDRKNFAKVSIVGAKEQNLAYTIATFDDKKAQTSYERKHLARDLARTGFTFKDYFRYSSAINDPDKLSVALAANHDGVFESPEKDFVMGKDVIEMTNRKTGAWMGELLTNLRDKQYRGDFANKEEALKFAREEVSRM